MLKVVMVWGLGLAVLVGGGLLVCPEGHCVPGDFDRAGLALADSLRRAWLDRLMAGATWLGSLWLLLPIAGLAAGMLLWRGRRREAGFVLLALLGASALGQLAKLWVARARPDLFAAWLPMPESWSYPSSHAMQATAAALALFLVARNRGVKKAGALAAAVLLVGASRVYLQVHFPSDVIAGTLAAALWVAGLHALVCGRRPAPPG
jgi:membrane-associated phospholipid phosphatase